MIDQAFYFGCHRTSGHYLWVRGMTKVDDSQVRAMSRFRNLIDGGFLPHESVQQGRAWLSQVGDWTFLAFVDNSIDSRPGSHSTFARTGRVDYRAMVAVSRLEWPEVWDRFKFEVYPAEKSTGPVIQNEIEPMLHNVPGETCPVCTAPEVEAMTPQTVYACGSSDYDQRPGTFLQGPRCKAKPGCPVCDDRGPTNLRDAGHRPNAVCDGKPRAS